MNVSTRNFFGITIVLAILGAFVACHSDDSVTRANLTTQSTATVQIEETEELDEWVIKLPKKFLGLAVLPICLERKATAKQRGGVTISSRGAKYEIHQYGDRSNLKSYDSGGLVSNCEARDASTNRLVAVFSIISFGDGPFLPSVSNPQIGDPPDTELVLIDENRIQVGTEAFGDFELSCGEGEWCTLLLQSDGSLFLAPKK